MVFQMVVLKVICQIEEAFPSNMDEFLSLFFTSQPSKRGVRAKQDDFSTQQSMVTSCPPGRSASSRGDPATMCSDGHYFKDAMISAIPERSVLLSTRKKDLQQTPKPATKPTQESISLMEIYAFLKTFNCLLMMQLLIEHE